MANTHPENPIPEESISTDANPVSARPIQTSSIQPEIQRQTEHNTDEIANTSANVRTLGSSQHMLRPPEDWQFNALLKNIADGLSTEDLENMKWMFEGEGGIGRGVLEKMQTPMDLFRILRKRGYISRDNIIYLQAILFWAGRKDLIKEAVEFSKTIGEIVHFYAPSDQPENGYKYVKFHIDGKDFKNYRRSDIENLRRDVSMLLCVPLQYVFIRGIEPSSSLVVTLMMPEMYVDILNDLLNDGEDFPDLNELGVDAIELDAKTLFNIKGEGQDLESISDQQAKFVNIYEKLKETKSCLDATEADFLQLSHQLELMQSKLNESEKMLEKSESNVENLKNILSVTGNGSQPATLKEICSLTEFTESLHQINLESVDRRVIQRLINSTVNIVRTRVRESQRILEQRMLLEIQEMESKLVPLMYEVERYKILTDLNNGDKSMQDNLKLLLQSILAQAMTPQVELSLTQHGLQVMRKVSEKLRPKEKEKLKQKYQWFPDGEIEKFMEADQNRFLAGLFYKEVEKEQAPVDGESFIAKCLTEVKREDLKKYLDRIPAPNPRSPRYAADTRHRQERQYSFQGRFQQQQQPQQQQQQQQQQQVQSEGTQFQEQQDDQKVLITRMAKQVQEMHNMLQTRQETNASKYDPWRTPSFPFNPQSFPQNQAL